MTNAGSRAATLAAVCDTFVPATDGLPSASTLGVPERIQAEIAALRRPSLSGGMDQLLDALDSPLANLALALRPIRFRDLSAPEREAYLLGWAASPIDRKRRAFQVVKRLTLLYAYGADGSPYWQLAGYAPPQLDPPAPAVALRVRTPRSGEVFDTEACVIGSGAGGAVAAARLAAAGKRVVILERARLRTEEEFDGRELAGFATLFLDRGLASTADRAITLLAGSAVGGGTVVNWNTSLRLPPGVREEWRASGIDAAELDPHYDAVEARIDVDADESARNGPNSALERGLRALGIPCETIRRNTRGCGDCGHCTYGCRRGAKRSTMRTYLEDACRDGAELLHESEARRIVLSRGRVSEVVVRVPGGEATIRAPLVALAGGSILSPALLLRSGIAVDRAGRGLRLHPFAVVAGLYDEDMLPWSGVPQSVVTHAFTGPDGAGGFRVEAGPALPGTIASAVTWWGAGHHRRIMSEARRFAPFGGFVRDRAPGRIKVDREGEPVIAYSVGPAERVELVHAQRQMARIHAAAGARRILTLHTPPLDLERGGDERAFAAELERRGIEPNRVTLLSAHQMATCPIGRSPRDSVADPDGQVWGARGVYVTDASAFPNASGVNPMLTVMALAGRTAERMLA